MVCCEVCVCMLCHFGHVQLYSPMDSSPPGSSVHGILWERILEWVAIPFSRVSSRPKDQTYVFCLLHWQVGSLPLVPLGSPCEVCMIYIKVKCLTIVHERQEGNHSIIHKFQRWTTQMSTNRWWDKKNVVCMCNGILFSFKKEALTHATA